MEELLHYKDYQKVQNPRNTLASAQSLYLGFNSSISTASSVLAC